MIENAAIILKKKYSKANHLDGIIFLNPNNGKLNVMPKSRIIQTIKEKFNLLRYFDENQNKQPISEKNSSIANPVVSANLSMNGGKYVAYPTYVSGLSKRLACPVM